MGVLTSTSSLCWCGRVAVVVVSPWYLPWASRRRRRLRYVGVDPLPSSSSHLGICHGRFDVSVFVVLTWTRCRRRCCHLFVMLVWTRCCRRRLALAFAIGVSTLSSSSIWRGHAAVLVMVVEVGGGERWWWST